LPDFCFGRHRLTLPRRMGQQIGCKPCDRDGMRHPFLLSDAARRGPQMTERRARLSGNPGRNGKAKGNVLTAHGERKIGGRCKLAALGSRLLVIRIHAQIARRERRFRPRTLLCQDSQITNMRKLLQIFPVLLIVAGALLLSERPAYGYADPGTGLLAIQTVGSAPVASGWYLGKRSYSLLRRDFATRQESEETATTKEDEGATPQ